MICNGRINRIAHQLCGITVSSRGKIHGTWVTSSFLPSLDYGGFHKNVFGKLDGNSGNSIKMTKFMNWLKIETRRNQNYMFVL